MTKQRITLISLVGFLVFILLIGGQILYKKNWVDKSILNQSQEIPGVLSAKVVEENDVQELNVVTDNIINLRQASLSLEKLAGNLPIRFKDTRTPELEELFNQMQFPLQEGMIRGNFTEMALQVKDLANQAGVQINLAMDSGAIYLTLNKGDAQLVEVIERHGQGQFLSSEGSSK